MDIMGPKLHKLVEQIVGRQTVDKSADQVRPMIGTRLGTSAPSDMFALMSENMSIVKSKSSPSLQVRHRLPR